MKAPSLWVASSLLVSFPFLIQASDQKLLSSEEDISAMKAHYEQAENEIRLHDISQLSSEQRAERERLLEVFREYREKGNFGRNHEFPDQRMPYFVDPEGRRCAVANLLEASGRGELVAKIAKTQNHAWVAELSENAELKSWLEDSGLTIEEAARIQGPHPLGGGVAMITPRRVAESSYRGAGDSTGSPLGPPPPPGLPGIPAPLTKGVPAGPTRATSTNIVTETFDEWSNWWEANKYDFLLPHFLGEEVAPTTFSSDDSALQNKIDLLREKASALIQANLKDKNAEVRAAAIVAFAKIDPNRALSFIRQAFQDSNLAVRQNAILALGVSGNPEAMHLLLQIEREGKLVDNSISPFARPLAIVALGIAKKLTHNDEADPFVIEALRTATGSENNEVKFASSLYQTLAPNKEMVSLLQDSLTEEKDFLPARCRAAESLAKTEDRESLVKLIRVLSGRQIELRRSAALTLGEFQHSLALQPLQTAFELESDYLTRGFLLISIGKQAGPDAKAFLTKRFYSLNSHMRPWAAIALGLLCRKQMDTEAAKLIREAYPREQNLESRNAYLLALGIAKDPLAVEILSDALFDGKTGSTRSYAAMALAMLGTPESRELIITQIPKEKCLPTKSVLSQALAFFGDARDSQLLSENLKEDKHPQIRAAVAMGLGLHGTVGSVEILSQILAKKDLSTSERAAAIDALGFALAKHQGIHLFPAFRSANFSVFPDWLREIFPVLI